jgi:hypothetical protein
MNALFTTAAANFHIFGLLVFDADYKTGTIFYTIRQIFTKWQKQVQKQQFRRMQAREQMIHCYRNYSWIN